MARRGRRVTLAPCIYQDASGLAVKVRVAGRLVEHRYPPGTPLEQLEEDRDRLQRRQALAQPAPEGTLRADVLAYLRTLSDPTQRSGQQILCAHWVARYGAVARQALTPLVIRQQLAAWRRGGAAASTCNHRLSALRAVWRAVSTPDEPDYPRQVRKLPEPAPEPRALSYAVIAQILAAMPDRGQGKRGETRGTVSLTKLRCALMAYTGLPPAQIMAIDPATDIDWQTPALRVRPRRKGRGRPETWLPLIPQAVETLRALQAAGGFGRYSNDAVSASFRRACVTVLRAQLAAGEPPLPHRVRQDGTLVPLVRVYDLRHSFGTMALTASKRLDAVRHLMLHADSRQTERYTLAAVPAAVADAAAAISATLRADAGPVPSPTAKAEGTNSRAGRKSAKSGRKTARARSSAG